MKQKETFLCIDLKSFYASVECVERGLDPFTTNLVVADPDRSVSTIGGENMLAEAYQKYLYVPRPVSKRYPMDVQHRAKQFVPFAALRGFEEIIRKQEVLYEERKVLSEEQKCGLDRKLQMISVGMKIQATYFKESREMQPTGQYHTICGTVEFFDPSIHLRIDDTIILIPDLCELSGDIFEELELPC